MAQPGEIAIGGAAIASPNPGWSFQLETKSGTYDLFLFAANQRFELESFGVRHGVAVNSDLNMGTIDLTQESLLPLVQRTYQVSNVLPDESSSAFSWIVSAELELHFFRDAFPLGQPRLYHEARMTRSYVAAAKATQLELDFRTIPGFKPERHQPQDIELTLSLSTDKGNPCRERGHLLERDDGPHHDSWIECSADSNEREAD